MWISGGKLQAKLFPETMCWYHHIGRQSKSRSKQGRGASKPHIRSCSHLKLSSFFGKRVLLLQHPNIIKTGENQKTTSKISIEREILDPVTWNFPWNLSASFFLLSLSFLFLLFFLFGSFLHLLRSYLFPCFKPWNMDVCVWGHYVPHYFFLIFFIFFVFFYFFLFFLF